MTQQWCNSHGGYSNADKACLFCRYDQLELANSKCKACEVYLMFNSTQDAITGIKVYKCRRHSK